MWHIYCIIIIISSFQFTYQSYVGITHLHNLLDPLNLVNIIGFNSTVIDAGLLNTVDEYMQIFCGMISTRNYS